MKAAAEHIAKEAACAVVDEVFCGLPVAELHIMINAHVQKGHGHQDVKPEVKKFMLEHGFWAAVDAAEEAGWSSFFLTHEQQGHCTAALSPHFLIKKQKK